MKTTIFGIILLGWALAFTSCKKSPGNSSPNSYPMQVRMTDAAGPYDAVYIDIESVQVNTDVNGSDNAWVILNTHAGVYDLTKYTNGMDTILASNNLSAGTVSQIRLILGPNNSVVVQGQSFPLKTPSAQQSGLKILVNYTLVAGVNFEVILDFDASRSIVAQGNGGYLLKPVIRAETVIAASGAIKGIVSPASTFPAVYAISGADTIGTYSDVYGNFRFNGISPGTYNVAFVPLAPMHTKIVSGVAVVNGSVTDMGIVTLP